MKTILCYGDSNTWGWKPTNLIKDYPAVDRYDINERWPGILRSKLGADFLVIEEGLNGRTTVWEDPLDPGKNGKEYLMPCLYTHAPIDLVIIMLGTNDLKSRFCVAPYDIASGAGFLVNIVQSSFAGPGGKAPKVLLIAPPPLAKLAGGEFEYMFAGGEEMSKELAPFYKGTAEAYGCAYLDAGQYVVTSSIDGVHFELSGHRKLGEALASAVKEMF